MNRWLRKNPTKRVEADSYFSMVSVIKDMYKTKLLPLEEYYSFTDFHSSPLDDANFDGKPMVLFMGQYSTGKTTFIKYILESEFPGIRIGPEPTTDKFTVIMHGEREGLIPGNAAVVDPTKQFRGLAPFGNTFLNRFQVSVLNSPVLQSITLVDTPGILAGEKQRIDRGYDFTAVLKWFAERVDAILLLFDAHKLDISDELKRCIESISPFEDKMMIVLNKADMLNHQQLLRVYGALMWSLGKVWNCPEVVRVFIGSFWDQPLQNDINRRLFQDEENDLFDHIQSLPKNSAVRKLNDLIRRSRLARIHALIIRELRREMPMMVGKEHKKKNLIDNLDQVYLSLQKEYHIPSGDFPDIQRMKERLLVYDFNKFKPGKVKLFENVEQMVTQDIAKLMSSVPHEELFSSKKTLIRGGSMEYALDRDNPFNQGRQEGVNAGIGESDWIVSRYRERYDDVFYSLNPVDGKVSGNVAKTEFLKSKLPNSVLRKIWVFSDIDRDGQLDGDEFALAMYLLDLKVGGFELPQLLPDHLVPPTKRFYKRHDGIKAPSFFSMKSYSNR